MERDLSCTEGRGKWVGVLSSTDTVVGEWVEDLGRAGQSRVISGGWVLD